MDVKELKAAADLFRPVLVRIPISGGAQKYVLCRRIQAVCWVVPEGQGGFWAAECIENKSGAVYRVRAEDIREDLHEYE